MARAASQLGKRDPHYPFGGTHSGVLFMPHCVSAINCIQHIINEFLEELLTIEDVELGRW
jgi:hypothetical protein